LKKQRVIHEIDGDEYVVGEVYEVDGEEIVYRGILSEFPLPNPGLYWDDFKDEFIIVPKTDPKKDIMDILDEEDPKRKNNNSRKLSHRENEDNNSGRSSSEDLLRFRESDEDDKVVRELKRIINQRNYTLKQVMEAGFDYNLVYGLKTRRSIKLASLEKWAKFLNMDVEFSLIPKK
jgi:hypothetical protein